MERPLDVQYRFRAGRVHVRLNQHLLPGLSGYEFKGHAAVPMKRSPYLRPLGQRPSWSNGLFQTAKVLPAGSENTRDPPGMVKPEPR